MKNDGQDNDEFYIGHDWRDSYDDLLMAELERLTSTMIDMKEHFEGVAWDIAVHMASVYGSKINEW